MIYILAILPIDYDPYIEYNRDNERGKPHKQKGANQMSINEMEKRIEKMQEWEALADEARAEAEAIRDSIKAEMLARQTEELSAGKYIVRWTSAMELRSMWCLPKSRCQPRVRLPRKSWFSDAER